MSEVRIRPARPDELGDVGRLRFGAYEQYRDRFDPSLWPVYEEELRDARACAAAGEVLVAERDGRLVGCASLRWHDSDPGGTAFLKLLAVAPDVRTGGVGRMVMDEVVARSRAMGAHTLLWHSLTLMEPAVAFYRRLGLEAESEQELAPGLSLLTYRMPLGTT